MSLVFESVTISPSMVNVGQGYIMQVSVTELVESFRLLDFMGVILHDKEGLTLLAKQEEV